MTKSNTIVRRYTEAHATSTPRISSDLRSKLEALVVHHRQGEWDKHVSRNADRLTLVLDEAKLSAKIHNN